ncbi:MAG: hypothetical protein IT339_01650 [Thermomicrobiales bacterium]|nr:hypothetical protein [Thermomicrobiales bacterium]
MPNQSYDVEFGGFRGSAPITPIWRQLTTDQAGAFDSIFNIGFLGGDQAFATIENVTSGLVNVSC